MEEQGISKLDLKRRNRMQILRVMQQHGAISRIDIASELKLTRAAVTIITGEMIQQGVLTELGEAQYGKSDKVPKGRKKILLNINPNHRFAMGVSIDEKRITAGLTTLDGNILDKRILEYDSITREKFIDFIVESHKALMADNCLTNEQLLGVGVCIHTAVAKGHDVVPERFPAFEEELSELLGTNVLAAPLADYMALAYADFQNRHASAPKSLVFIYFATHYSLILIDNCQQITANRMSAEYLGSYIVNPNGRKLEGYPDGSIEAELTPAAILTKVKEIYSREETPTLYAMTEGDFGRITLPFLFEAMDSGDEALYKVFLGCAKMMAVLINNLACANGPEQIILHNFFFPEKYMDKLKGLVAKISCQPVADIVSDSGMNAEHGFLAGCDLAIRKLFYEMGGYDAPKPNEKTE